VPRHHCRIRRRALARWRPGRRSRRAWCRLSRGWKAALISSPKAAALPAIVPMSHHRWAVRVLDLQPIPGSPRPIGRRQDRPHRRRFERRIGSSMLAQAHAWACPQELNFRAPWAPGVPPIGLGEREAPVPRPSSRVAPFAAGGAFSCRRRAPASTQFVETFRQCSGVTRQVTGLLLLPRA
jgi:hypothetical protein